MTSELVIIRASGHNVWVTHCFSITTWSMVQWTVNGFPYSIVKASEKYQFYLMLPESCHFYKSECLVPRIHESRLYSMRPFWICESLHRLWMIVAWISWWDSNIHDGLHEFNLDLWIHGNHIYRNDNSYDKYEFILKFIICSNQFF